MYKNKIVDILIMSVDLVGNMYLVFKRTVSLINKGSIVIYCCGIYNSAERRLELAENQFFKDRYLEITHCDKCQKLKAQLVQHRIEDGKRIDKHPQKGKVADFIKQYESEKHCEFKYKNPKYGTQFNMSWTWADGSKDNWVRDFNGTKKFKLKGEINLSLVS